MLHSVLPILSVILVGLVLVALWPSRKKARPVPSWLGWLIERENPLAKYNRVNYILQELDVQSGMTVFDIGCGPGRLSIPLAEKVGLEGKVIAADIQQGMLLQAQRKAEARNMHNIEFVHIDISKEELKQEVDRAVLVTVLGEIPDKKAALRNLFDALKPGGILCIIETLFDPQDYQKREVVTQLTSEAGFREIALKGNRFEYLVCLEKPKGVYNV